MRRCLSTNATLTALATAISLTLAVLVGSAAPARAFSLVPGENVRTEYGVVQGSVQPDHRRFQGIPFAAPPVGDLRFAAPAAPRPWSGERPARFQGPPCAQGLPILGSLYPSSEDCLYLDVYTPPLARSRNLPVMVWFYGGAYLLGSTNQYDPKPLVTGGDVIVVQVSYRVGPFGFLTLPGAGGQGGSGGLAGNYGLLDQQAGLRWVQRNIAGYGGDRKNVTIFGESTGGNTVCQLLASPTAAGLFAKAITMSGGCGSSVLDAQPAARAHALARAYAAEVGCTAPATVIACLRSRSKDALLKPASTRFEAMNVDWRPTVDQKVVPALTGESFRAGAFNRVPVMVGGAHDEGRMLVGVLRHALRLGPVSASTYRADVEQAFGPRAPAVLAHSPATGNLDLGLSKIWTDGLFDCPAAGSIEGLRRHAPVTYAYEFDDPNPPVDQVDPFMPWGAYHGSDLWYLFDRVFSMPRLYLDPAQRALSRELIGYWTTFARTGDPNGAGRPAWPKASTGRLLKLTSEGSSPKSLTAFAADHDCTFWSPLA